MKQKTLFRFGLVKATMAILGTMAFAACTSMDDNAVTDPSGFDSEGVDQGAVDVAYGKLFHFINTDSLENYRFPLAALKDVTIETEPNEYFGVKVEEADGKRFVTPYQKKEPTDSITISRVKVYPKGNPSAARNVFFVFGKRNAAQARTRASAPSTVYSSALGKGTYCYGEIGNIVGGGTPIFNYDAMIDGNLYTSASINTERFFEIEGQAYEETVNNYSWNVGVDIKSAKVGGLLSRGLFNRLAQNRDPAALKMTLKLSGTGSDKSTSNMEYFMKVCLVQEEFVSLNVNNIFYNENLTKRVATNNIAKLASFLNKDFISTLAEIAPDSLNWVNFYDSWGTDVITQGVFGGYLRYIYGRQSTAYETSSSIDAAVALQYTDANIINTNLSDQAQALQMQNPKEQYAVDGGYAMYDSDYMKVTNAFHETYQVGGNMNFKSVTDWLAGFNSNKDTWKLISYRYEENGNYSGQESFLLPVETVAEGVVANYLASVGSDITEADKAICDRIIANAQKLLDNRWPFIEERAKRIDPENRLVVADFRAWRGDYKRPAGEPKARIAEDIRGNKHLYFPVMANDYAPQLNGYTMDTSTEEFFECSNAEDWDLYFWYALEPANKCDGFTDIIFEEDSWFDNSFEWKRTGLGDGETSKLSTSSDNYPQDRLNAIRVKFADENTPDSLKITAVGISKYKNNDRNNTTHDPTLIIASTGGSELHYNSNAAERKAFAEFWEGATHQWQHDWHDDVKKTGWFGIVKYQCGTHIHPVYSTKNLNITNVRKVCHPKKWGE